MVTKRKPHSSNMENNLSQKINDLEKELKMLKDEFYRYNDVSSKVETKAMSFKSRVGFFGKQPIEQPAAVSSPTGGVTIDSQARTAIDSLRSTLQNLGLTA